MNNLLIVSEQVAILFALMAVGFVCRRAKTVSENGIGEIVALLICVINPAVIIHAFNRTFDPSMMEGLLIALALAFAMHLFLLLLVRVAFRGGAADSRVVLKLSATFSNAGFMGIPLEQAILGPEGVFYGVAYVVVFNLFVWSWGVAQCADGELKLTRKMIFNPGMYAISAGLLVFLLPFELPRVLSQTLDGLAAMNTPLAMMVIGYYLAGAKFAAVIKSRAAYLAMAIRLLVSPLVAIGVVLLLRGVVEETILIAFVIPASAPVAAMTSMFAAEYRRDVDLSAALVSATTLLSILTMPVMIALAMR